MKLTQHTTPASFLEEATPFLTEAEAENGLMLGIAGALPETPDPDGSPPWLMTVGTAGRVVACAIRTPPKRVLITQGPTEALQLLAEGAAERGADLPGVLGPRGPALDYAAHWARLTGRTHEIFMEQGIYRLDSDDLTIPETSGRSREATADDIELLASWIAQFKSEADPGDTSDARSAAEHRVKEGSVFVWEDGSPVSIAAFSGPTPNGIRISLVYTPPESRGRGYASALVGRLSGHLLSTGKAFCLLYTDMANPTANKIYRQLGYRLVCDAVMVDFA